MLSINSNIAIEREAAVEVVPALAESVYPVDIPAETGDQPVFAETLEFVAEIEAAIVEVISKVTSDTQTEGTIAEGEGQSEPAVPASPTLKRVRDNETEVDETSELAEVYSPATKRVRDENVAPVVNNAGQSNRVVSFVPLAFKPSSHSNKPAQRLTPYKPITARSMTRAPLAPVSCQPQF